MTISGGRRRVRFPNQPDRADPVADEPSAVSALVFTLRFPDSPDCTVDLADASCPGLLRELAAAVRQLAQVGGRIRARGTAYAYLGGIRKLDAFLAARLERPAEVTAAALSPRLLDEFEVHLYASVPLRRTAYNYLAVVIVLLRHLRGTRPQVLHPDMPARLRFGGRQPYPRPSLGVDAYPGEVVAAVRAACREQVRRAVRRITVDGAALLARGQDPRQAGWDDEANLLWEIQRRGVLRRGDLHRELGRSPDSRRGGGPGLERLHSLLYPSEADLIALAILVVLGTGLEPESLRELTVDCLKNPAAGHVEVEYVKRRRHGHEWNRLRVRDGNATTPGGLLRLALRLTRHARAHLPSTRRLWVCCQRLPHLLAVSKLSVHDHSGAAALVAQYGLVDGDGTPLSVDLRRLRKTYKAEFYRATGGQLPLLAQGHSTEVAATRYADIAALRDVHENAIVDGLSEALADAVSLRVLTTADEQRLAAEPDQAPQVAGVAADQVPALLAGELDVWLSSCRDFTNSPFGTKGNPCPVPFWSCLDCSNAIITSRKLPAVLAFLDHIEAQRAELSADAWAAVHGVTRQRILTQILPAFPADVVAQARAIAEADQPLEHLPPLFPGIGARP